MAARKKVTKTPSKVLHEGASRVVQKAKRPSSAKTARAAPAPKAAAAKSEASGKRPVSTRPAGKAAGTAKGVETPKTEVPVAAPQAPVAAEVKAARVSAAPRKPASAEVRGGPKGVQTGAGEEGHAKGAASATAAAAPAGAAQKPAEAIPEPEVHLNGAKAARAPAPTKPADRDSSGGEQKTMKSNPNKHGFKLNEFVVYPAHGVGQIVSMEEQEVAGFKLELFVINFVKDKMTLRVPTSKVSGVGMRKLSDPEAARRSLEILTGRARVKRTMWSRRAQEYEAKINSGDINAIAEVVRDLYRSEAQPEQSYSERQLYEAALDRMMREIAAVQKISEAEALKVIDGQLKKNAKRGQKGEAGEGEDGAIEEAA